MWTGRKYRKLTRHRLRCRTLDHARVNRPNRQGELTDSIPKLLYPRFERPKREGNDRRATIVREINQVTRWLSRYSNYFALAVCHRSFRRMITSLPGAAANGLASARERGWKIQALAEPRLLRHLWAFQIADTFGIPSRSTSALVSSSARRADLNPTSTLSSPGLRFE
jgi:hypothetical protein